MVASLLFLVVRVPERLSEQTGSGKSNAGEDDDGQWTYNSAMLKRIYIDNFRCFVNFEYKPERKQLLLGENGCGKSSLLEALQAVRDFLRKGGGDTVAIDMLQNGRTRGRDETRQVFEIDAELDGRQYIYHIEFQANGDASRTIILAEFLKVEGSLIFLRSAGEDPGYPTLHLRKFETEVFPFYDWIAHKVFCFRINPYAMKTTGILDVSVHPVFDMSDLADWYMRLVESEDEGLSPLNDSLKELFDGFESLNLRELQPIGGPQPQSGELTASFRGPESEMTFALDELSEGQRCLIALYMILHFLIAKGDTVFLDEPDNFISLREIQPWLLAAEDAVEESKGQLILISHHPEIMNYWAREYGLLFSREENGHVRAKPYREVADTGLDPAETIARGWEDE
jgi:predicted ATPase